jgi:tetratricopeptide (TPR) repeat protein
MPRAVSRSLASLLIALLCSPPAWATCGGGGGGGRGGMAPAGQEEQVYHVPWKVYGQDGAAPKEGLALYWFPASTQEVQLSSLRTSRTLSLYASQCVSMLLADATMPVGQQFKVAERLPMVVLAKADGTPVAEVEGEKGKLYAPAVEKLLSGEMSRRENALKQSLEDAKGKARSGDTAAAVLLLKSVYAERCLFPKRANDAAKELKKLGQDVKVETGEVTSPVFDPARSGRIEKTMLDGLKAENEGRYEVARKLYLEAEALDPADPAPIRYHGELLRHHTGEWDKARGEFERILAMRADPLSRAVALHGLGKMTIHAGQFDRGREMMEESVATYPLALAYRNLAVYWNSEGDLKKTGRYVDEALRLDPKDPYNIVFAAVFKATSGHVDEALRIAQENESMLPASYNLAAIHAIAGHRETALRLLRRHFQEYERYDAVRGEEMMEARVDAVFASLREDPAFLSLTDKADGRMAMPAGRTSH